MFSIHPKPNVHFLLTFILPSGNTLNLDQTKILSFGKELTKFLMLLLAVLKLYHNVLCTYLCIKLYLALLSILL